MNPEDIKIGDKILFSTGGTMEVILIDVKSKRIYLDSSKNYMSFLTFQEAFRTKSIAVITSKQSPRLSKTTRQNNDGLSTCYFCGGATRKCGGMRFDQDYRCCTVCGK